MEIRDYKQGDEKYILPLFEQTFGKPMSEKFWKWRFLDNPVNKIMIKLMWDQDLLVGHYAASPVCLLHHNTRILTALSMTTMTHPDYAGKGIFSKLAEELYTSEAEKNQLAAVWGYPNTNSHYAFIKNLKWNNLESVPTFSLAVQKIKEKNSNRFRPIDAFSSEHSAAAEKVTEEYAIRMERSQEYLTWRYSDHPENTYHIFECQIDDLTYFVVTKVFSSFEVPGKSEVDFVEFILPNDEELLASCLSEVRAFYADYDLLKFNLWLPLNDPKHITLEKLGFTNALPVTYFGIKLLNPEYSRLLNDKQWDYSLGYSDIY